jgi:hypothetical protein
MHHSVMFNTLEYPKKKSVSYNLSFFMGILVPSFFVSFDALFIEVKELA